MSKPMRIGLLTPACTGFNALDSGIGQHFADLALGLSALGHSVWIITPVPPANFASDRNLAKLRFAPFPTKMPRWLNLLSGVRWQLHTFAGLRFRIAAADRSMAACAEQNDLDVIETTSSGLLAARYLRRKKRAPVVTRVSTTAAQLVAHNGGTAHWTNQLEQRSEQRLARKSDGLITHTLQHRDEISRAWQIPPTAFTVIPHGIALPDAGELVSSATHEAIEVLYVGRFEHRKGIDTLLAAIPRIIEQHAKVRFTMIGHDPGNRCQTKFQKEHARLPEDKVRFLGQVSPTHLAAAYRDCDIFAAPSRYESFGLIYVEAMSWGKPVVACASGGTAEVVKHGETGWLIEPGDTDGLVARILDLARDDTTRLKFGNNARGRVERHFSRAALCERSLEYYHRILAEISSRTK